MVVHRESPNFKHQDHLLKRPPVANASRKASAQRCEHLSWSRVDNPGKGEPVASRK